MYDEFRTWLRIVDEETRRAQVPLHQKEEAMGAVLVALVRERPSPENVRVCAKRRIIDWIRAEIGKDGRRGPVRNTLPLHDSHQAPDWTDAAEARVMIATVMPKLTPRQQAVVCVMLDGHSAADAARLLGTNRTAIIRILEQVRRKMEGWR